MGLCESCGKNEATHHITVQVTVFGPKSTKIKRVQFMLCPECELASQQVLANDVNRRARMAQRLTKDPEFFSRWRAWREKRDADRLDRAAIRQ